jgi:predicted nucleic acid-binding protein
LILDTNAVSALLAGDPALASLLAEAERHHLPAIVLGEYRYGLLRARDSGRLGRLLDLLAAESIVLPVSAATADHYAVVRDELRRQGTPIPENDVWIAALARQHRLTLVSRDRHFDQVPELTRREW